MGVIFSTTSTMTSTTRPATTSSTTSSTTSGTKSSTTSDTKSSATSDTTSSTTSSTTTEEKELPLHELVRLRIENGDEKLETMIKDYFAFLKEKPVYSCKDEKSTTEFLRNDDYGKFSHDSAPESIHLYRFGKKSAHLHVNFNDDVERLSFLFCKAAGVTAFTNTFGGVRISDAKEIKIMWRHLCNICMLPKKSVAKITEFVDSLK